MIKVKKIWNHNYAYNRWISGVVDGRKRILDVGCGNGTLAFFLRTPHNHIVGIDPSESSIAAANAENRYDNVEFLCSTFEEFALADRSFDAVIFVASIHHMDMNAAIRKAKKCLEKNGVLIIVGLAQPSGLLDRIVELLRVIPSGLVSAVKKNTSSEKLSIETNYSFPKMDDVRKICKENLSGCKMRYGLHYRYLLAWENR